MWVDEQSQLGKQGALSEQIDQLERQNGELQGVVRQLRGEVAELAAVYCAKEQKLVRSHGEERQKQELEFSMQLNKMTLQISQLAKEARELKQRMESQIKEIQKLKSEKSLSEKSGAAELHRLQRQLKGITQEYEN